MLCTKEDDEGEGWTKFVIFKGSMVRARNGLIAINEKEVLVSN